MEHIPKALILEDEALKLDLRESLKRDGFNTRIARSVDHLIALAEGDHFDAGIIDIRLTQDGTEGLDAIRKLRAIKPTMYLEVLTAYKEFKPQAMFLGADAVSFKPGGVIGLGPRIRRGILEKRLNNFSNQSGVDKSTIDRIVAAGGDEPSTGMALNAEVLSRCAHKINAVLDEFSPRVEAKEIDRMKKSIMEIMLSQLSGDETVAMDIQVSSPPSLVGGDRNLVRFLEQLAELKTRYMNQYVAFVSGNFVNANPDLLELHRQLDNAYPEEETFIKKIVADEKPISFRRPRRIYKN